MNSTKQKPESRYAICAGCSLLCDDIEIGSTGNLLTECCPAASEWFSQPSPGMQVFIDGSRATLEEAIERSGRILNAASSPLVSGLDGISSQAQMAAWSIADSLHGFIDISIHNAGRSGMLALQRIGKSTATLGEVANRSKLVVFWFCDPEVVCSGLIEKVCRSAEEVIFVGATNGGHSAAIKHSTIELEPSRALAALDVLRLLAGSGPDCETIKEEAVKQATGHSLSVWQDLVSRVGHSHYAAMFYGEPPLTGHGNAMALTERLYEFVIRVNRTNRFVILAPQNKWNSASARHVLSSSCGYPFAVKLHPFPQFNGLEFSAEAILNRAVCDSLLLCSTLSSAPEDVPATLPVDHRIVLTHQPERWRDQAAVVIATGLTGVDQSGDWMRMDGVVLPMRAVRDPSLTFNTADILGSIADSV